MNLDHIVFSEHKDIKWQFHGGQPSISVQKIRDGWFYETVDPFPCYVHDEKLTRQCIDEVRAAFHIPIPCNWFILPYEDLSRTNGEFQKDSIYSEEEQKKYGDIKWMGVIVLKGKRIPIMPTMTRYLVSHEYGHFVEAYIRRERKYDDDNRKYASRDKFLEDYMKLRNGDFSMDYGALKWHANAAEIFANDFRIIVARKETEFWPHPVNHPLENSNIIEWWHKAKEQHGTKQPEPTIEN